jgi:hypothetical protein
VVKVFWKKKKEYMEWDAYEKKITFMEILAWQQRVRRNNIANMKC